MSRNIQEFTVTDIRSRACQRYRYPEKSLDDSQRKAMEKKIRRILKGLEDTSGLERTRPLCVDEKTADEVVGKLRPYVRKLADRTLTTNKERIKRRNAERNLDAAREAMLSIYDERVEQFGAGTYTDSPDQSFGITPSVFTDFMLRALFYKAFPHFNEKQFLSDYEEREILSYTITGTGLPDSEDEETVDNAVRHAELSEKLDKALNYGDLGAYLPQNDTGRAQ